jgi:hypothetical protein
VAYHQRNGAVQRHRNVQVVLKHVEVVQAVRFVVSTGVAPVGALQRELGRVL